MCRMRTGRRAMAVAMVMATCACWGNGGGESSTGVETGMMAASFSARSVGTSGTDIRADLRIPGAGLFADQVNLNGGDRLIVKRIRPISLEERTRAMFEHDELFGCCGYGVGFPGDDKDTVFEIALARSATGELSANDSSVRLPTPFELDWVDDPVAMTAAPEPFSRSSSTPYFVVWDPFDAPDFEPGDAFGYEVSGSCIETLRGALDWQGGEDVLQLTEVLEDRDPPDDGKSCTIRVELTLSRTGTIDPAFADGSFVAEQVRVLKLRSTP
jgi:hypothetical protein